MVIDVDPFPQEWDEKKFGDVSSMNGRIGWQGLKQSEFTQNPENPFLITGMNFKDGIIHWDDVYHISKKRYKEAKNIQLKEEDILMTKDGTIGKILFIDDIPRPHKASLNSHLLVFRPIANQYVPKFMFYQLLSKSFLEHIEQNKSGTTFFGITEKAIEKFKIHLPPIPEQRNIAKSLSDLDELIQQLDYLIKKKKHLKQGIIQDLVTGKKRLSGYSKKWEIKKLGELLKYEQPTKYIVQNTEYGDIGTPVLTAGKTFILGHTQEELGIFKDLPTIIFDDFTTAKKFVTFPFKVKSSAMKILKPRTDKIDLKFIFESMGLIKFQLGDHKRYWISEYQNLEILLPDFKEQITISQILSDVDLDIKELEQKRDKYKKIKEGMMQKLLTGEIRLT